MKADMIRTTHQETVPPRLYKYVSSKWVRDVLGGRLLFRNLTYFRQCEDGQRGDPLEAHHRDNPKHGVTITAVSSGKIIRGSFSFLNSTNSDHIYVFCLSKICNAKLCEEFEGDACVQIMDVEEFLRRVRCKIVPLASTHKWGLLHGSIKYYVPDRAADFNVKDPRHIVFTKDQIFRHQDEYRLAFGTRRAFKLEEAIVDNRIYDSRAETTKGTVRERRINIGPISDIAKVKYM